MPEQKRGSLTKSYSRLLTFAANQYTSIKDDPANRLVDFTRWFCRGSNKPGRPEGSGLIEEDEALLNRMEVLCGTKNLKIGAAIERVANEEVIDDVTGNKRDNLTRRLRRKWRIRHPDWKSP